MSGFPTRPSRFSFGPTYKEDKPVTDPERELGEQIVNLTFWQLAGISRVSPLVIIKASVAGSAVSNDFQALAFDPNGAVAAITISYIGAGHYSFAFASQYPNEKGDNVSLSLIGGKASPANSLAASGSHTGLDNQAALTDSTKAWTTNEHVGKYIYNLTDGSKGLITANTANTVTATLAGGSENDWDNGDTYVILSAATVGIVHMSSGYQGEIFFFDNGTLADVPAFILELW